MWKVDIYLETDSTFQGKKKRKYGYVLATKLHGAEKTKEYFGISNDTYHKTILQAIIGALSRMTAPSEICIHTQDDYVASRIPKLTEMAEKDWKDTKGKSIRNAAHWEQMHKAVKDLPEPHELTARSGKHSYSTWMQEDMKKNGTLGKGMESATGAGSGNNGILGNDNPQGNQI